MKRAVFWSDADSVRVMQAYARGHYPGAYAEFPNLSRELIRGKVRRMLVSSGQRPASWPPEAVEVLMTAYDTGGYPAAYVAFPSYLKQTLRKKVARELMVRAVKVPRNRNVLTAEEQQRLPRSDSQAMLFRIAEKIAMQKRLRKRAA